MPTICRVTVWGPRRRLDVALPAAVPLAELVPLLVARDEEGAAQGTNGSGASSGELRPWVVSTVEGDDLTPDRSLADLGITHGTHLLLRRAGDEPVGVVASDVVETIAVATDAAAGQWTPGATRAAHLVVTAVMIVGLAAVLIVERGRRADALVAGAAAVVVAGLAWAAANRAPRAAAVLATAGSTLFAAAAVALADPGSAAGLVVAGGAGLLAGALIALATVPASRPPARAISAAAAVAALAGAAALRFSGVTTAAIVVLVAVAAVPTLPALALRLAGLGPAVLRGGADAHAEVAARGRRQLAWLLTADAALVLGAAVALASSFDGWALALAGVAGVVLVLRARAFRFVLEAAPLLAGGVGSVVAMLVALAVDAHGSSHWVAGIVVVAVVTALLIVPVFLAGQLEPALLQSTASRLETVVTLLLIPLAAGAFGIYSAVADAASRWR